MLRLVFALVWALLVAIFAVQNSKAVSISFLFWTVPSISEALIILLSVLLGAVLALAVNFLTRRRHPRDPHFLSSTSLPEAATPAPTHPESREENTSPGQS